MLCHYNFYRITILQMTGKTRLVFKGMQYSSYEKGLEDSFLFTWDTVVMQPVVEVSPAWQPGRQIRNTTLPVTHVAGLPGQYLFS